jgi:hypothetical protein
MYISNALIRLGHVTIHNICQALDSTYIIWVQTSNYSVYKIL